MNLGRTVHRFSAVLVVVVVYVDADDIFRKAQEDVGVLVFITPRLDLTRRGDATFLASPPNEGWVFGERFG